MGNLIERLQFIAQMVRPDQTALTDEETALSYNQLIDKVSIFANWLQATQCTTVALYAQNGIDWVIVDLACQQAGVVCVPLPAFFSTAQIEHCIAEAGVELLLSDQQDIETLVTQSRSFTRDQSAPSLHAWRIVNPSSGSVPNDTQKITFTSGSTGSPKGVCLSFKHQWLVAQSLADVIDIKQAKHLCLLPLSTLLENIAGVYSPLLSAGTVYLPSDNARGISGSSGLDIPAFLECLQRIEPQSMILLPQLLAVLVGACQLGWVAPDSLKFVAVGGAKVASGLIESARSYGLPVYQGYGLSECGSVVALNTFEHNSNTAVGRVLPHCNVAIENDEIIVHGASHQGYLNKPESWYQEKIRTGDIGSLQGDFLSVSGRKKNILITGFGRNVNPEWVESELMSQPLLNQCMVVGDGKPFLTALVSARDSVEDTVIEQWIDKVNQGLPDYARLQKWWRVKQTQWQGLLTANGRLRREQVSDVFKDDIERLYVSAQ